MHEIADFLREHEPFATLDPDALAELAESVEIEYFPAGELIFGQHSEPAERVRMVVTGAVALMDGERALDLLGPGELFGHPSMLAGLPTGLAARAQEDTISYGIPAEQMVPLLARPEGLRYVARSLSRRWRAASLSPEQIASDPTRRPVSALMREPVVIGESSMSVRDAARAMVERGASCAVIPLLDGTMGIITDRDLRVRVVAGEVPLDAPVADAMSAPAFTVPASRPGTEAMVEMINRGFRHLPVVSTRNEVVGVVTDIDLLAADTRTPFTIRRRIASAADVDDLVAAAGELRPTVIALHDSGVGATQLGAIVAAFADALTRRALELLTDQIPDLPVFAWLATGSMGRHEAFASSDVDSALVWEEPADPEVLRGIARRTLEVLARCRFVTDEHAATAAHALFARSVTDWRESIARYLDHPEDPRLPIVISVIADAHLLYANGHVSDAFAELRHGYRHPVFMDTVRRLALDHRPPTGFLRDLVVEHSGEHAGLLDIKSGGFLPIVGLARYLALINGITATGTIDRLRAAADVGACPSSDAADLVEAFELFSTVRMDHQIQQLRDGQEPTDFIDPTDLSPLVRRYLREAFRAIAGVQRRLPHPDVP